MVKNNNWNTNFNFQYEPHQVDCVVRDLESRILMELQQTNTAHFHTDFCLLKTNQVMLKQAEKGSDFVSSPL